MEKIRHNIKKHPNSKNFDIFLRDYSTIYAQAPEEIPSLIPSVKKLELALVNTKSYPKNFAQFLQLRELTLSNYQIKELPSFLQQLPKIQHLSLNLSKVRLEKQVEQLPAIRSLTIINFWGKKFPENLALISSLRKVILSEAILQKCDFTQMLEALLLIPQLQELEFEGPIDFKLIEGFIPQLQRLRKINFYRQDHLSELIPLARFTQTKIQFKYQFKEINFEQLQNRRQSYQLNDAQCMTLLALQVQELQACNDYIASALKDQAKPAQLCFARGLSRHLRQRVQDFLPETEIKIKKKGCPVPLFILQSTTPEEMLLQAFHKNIPIATEDQLKTYLTQIEDPWLAQKDSGEANEQLIQLLASSNKDNTLLAFELINGSGANHIVISMLAAIMMCSNEKEIQKRAETLFKKVGQSSTYQLLKKSKIYFRRSGNNQRKLKQLFELQPNIDEMAFRLMHHCVAGHNGNIADVEPQTLCFNSCPSSIELPSYLHYFNYIESIDFTRSNNIALEKSLEHIFSLPNLKALSFEQCKMTVDMPLQKIYPNITALNFKNNYIQDASFLKQFPALQILNLENCRIQALPTLSRFSNLQSLNLNRNKLSQVPTGLRQLQQLEELSLSYNNITQLNLEELPQKRLTKLNISHNALQELDYQIFNLPQLDQLQINHNELQSFDTKTQKISSKITTLNISSNGLKSFAIDKKQFLELSSLVLSQNKISKIQAELCKYLPKLYIFEAANNQIKELPVSFTQKYFHKINLSHNHFEEAPLYWAKINCQYLDMSYNRIAKLDPFILKESSQKWYFYWKFEGNPCSQNK